MFSHLKRNWHFHSMPGAANEKASKRLAVESLIPKKRLKVDEAEKVRKLALGHRVKAASSAKSKKPPASSTKEGAKSLPYVPEVRTLKPGVFKRVLVKRKTTPRLPYYDEIDKKALMVLILVGYQTQDLRTCSYSIDSSKPT